MYKLSLGLIGAILISNPAFADWNKIDLINS